MSEQSKNGPVGGGAEMARSTLLHWSGPALPSAIVGAAVLTSVRDLALSFAIVACVAWALVLMLTGLAISHQWDVCLLCTQPPRAVATSASRLRVARRVHSRVGHQLHKVLLLGLLVAALFPKPYVHHPTWLIRGCEALVLTIAVSLIVWRTLTIGLHSNYRSECPKETCRADIPRQPKRWSAELAHYAVWILLVLVPITTLVGVLALHLHGPWGIAYPTAQLIQIPLLIPALLHSQRPCVTCVRRLPTNGGEIADKRTLWLRLWHTATPWLISYALAATFVTFAISGTTLGRVQAGSAGLALTAQLCLSRIHGRVQPWCPWCRDNGGEDASSEAPAPTRNAPAPV